jgi:D-alanyl-D-alanine carboxypeptidase/D-alanyl-D-alanine-endopeptidase (penicillin-binding protein 4)
VTATGLVVAALLLASGCAAGSDAAAPVGVPATRAPVTAAVPATSAPATAPPTTLPPWTATTTTSPAAAPAGPCLGGAGAASPPAGPTNPAAATAAAEHLAPALDQLRGAGGSVGVTVWVDGVGEVAALQPAVPLVPASNQKLLVAAAALELLPIDTTLPTTVVATGPVVDGVVQGDLVLVGGGDPTLTRAGPHSLDTLAAAVGTAGITGATGRLLVDESRYDTVRTGAGWVEGAWQQSNVGLLSAVVVDRNRGYADPAFAADPALANLHAFGEALTAAGITVRGPTANEPGSGQAGVQVAAVASPPLPELITALLAKSDNLAAELLVKELGRRTSGVGSSAAGLEAARSSIVARCVALDGTDADGSGLSRTDARAPDAWRRLLEHARTRPWYPAFRDALAVSGQAGTLAARLGSGETVGRVRAKTGSTAVSGALSGYLTAASGASVTFSIVVNQPRAAPEPAIDAFVTELVRQL